MDAKLAVNSSIVDIVSRVREVAWDAIDDAIYDVIDPPDWSRNTGDIEAAVNRITWIILLGALR